MTWRSTVAGKRQRVGPSPYMQRQFAELPSEVVMLIVRAIGKTTMANRIRHAMRLRWRRSGRNLGYINGRLTIALWD